MHHSEFTLLWQVTRSAESYTEVFAAQKERLVYLTADSAAELAKLDSEDIYIIGGLVDRNRHKNICFERAQQQVGYPGHHVAALWAACVSLPYKQVQCDV